jgi:hypothetical protein
MMPKTRPVRETVGEYVGVGEFVTVGVIVLVGVGVRLGPASVGVLWEKAKTRIDGK